MDKVISIPEAMAMCDNDDDFFEELVEVMREDVLECSTLVASAYANNDPDALRQVAHRVKGQAASMAAKALRDASRKVEDASKNGSCTKTEYLQLMSAAQDFLRHTAKKKKSL
ncbi:unnamed protein product [Pylaiella littoralis]